MSELKSLQGKKKGSQEEKYDPSEGYLREALQVISEYLPHKIFEGLCATYGKKASDILRDNRKRKKKEPTKLGKGAPPKKKRKSLKNKPKPKKKTKDTRGMAKLTKWFKPKPKEEKEKS